MRAAHALKAVDQPVKKAPSEPLRARGRALNQMMRVAAATPPASTIIARMKR